MTFESVCTFCRYRCFDSEPWLCGENTDKVLDLTKEKEAEK